MCIYLCMCAYDIRLIYILSVHLSVCQVGCVGNPSSWTITSITIVLCVLLYCIYHAVYIHTLCCLSVCLSCLSCSHPPFPPLMSARLVARSINCVRPLLPLERPLQLQLYTRLSEPDIRLRPAPAFGRREWGIDTLYLCNHA